MFYVLPDYGCSSELEEANSTVTNVFFIVFVITAQRRSRIVVITITIKLPRAELAGSKSWYFICSDDRIWQNR